jgi:hypothetical protein
VRGFGCTTNDSLVPRLTFAVRVHVLPGLPSQAFVVGINRYASAGIINAGPGGSGLSVQLRILPLSRDAPIFVVWPPFPPGENSTLVLNDVSVVQASDVTLQTTG